MLSFKEIPGGMGLRLLLHCEKNIFVNSNENQVPTLTANILNINLRSGFDNLEAI